MKRSTKTAPVSLSTSYLMGSPRIGISTITLQSFGTSLPAGTRSRFIEIFLVSERDYSDPSPCPFPCSGALSCRTGPTGIFGRPSRHAHLCSPCRSDRHRRRPLRKCADGCGALGNTFLDAEGRGGIARRLGSRENHRGEEADAIPSGRR